MLNPLMTADNNDGGKCTSDYVRALLSDEAYNDDNDAESKYRLFGNRVHIAVRTLTFMQSQEREQKQQQSDQAGPKSNKKNKFR
jgi:hypothetical protein